MSGALRYFTRSRHESGPARTQTPPRHHFVATPVLLGCLLVAGVLAAMLKLFVRGPVQMSDALAFGAVIVLGEALRITLPGGRDNAPLAATAGLGYALTTSIGGRPAMWGPVQVIVVVAVAAVIGSVPQAIAGRPAPIGYLVRRIGVTGIVAWLLRTVLAPEIATATRTELLLLLSAMAILALLMDPALAAVFATSSGYYATGSLLSHSEYGDSSVEHGRPAESAAAPRTSLRRLLDTWFEECVATARICPAVAALSVAVALAADPLGLWVLPIAAAPVLVMQRALRRYSAIRATYQQTIRALSRMTDLAGYTDPGHARRVCRLALAIGRDLDLTEPELLDLEYAALLHDIGQLSLADPLPGGATVLATPWVAAEVAARGAEVVRETGVLDRVARVLEAQPLSYRAQLAVSEAAVGEDEAIGDESERRAAAILRVANDFEDLRTAEPGPSAHVSALARIRRGIGDPYDPRAVESLTRLVSVE
ncbi:hypothetical protein [Actinospica sp.]|jgi:hypothetical protein|uniref:HD-GYP domain-containing protein n=1 Tax=Actinospica sp. TaxID=1872142 RepID=UPI002BD19A40|nr:hypothetical protein [Actinospica sp.]HWG25925.1 hypothetical protein [Actinospica sp.]